MKFEKFDKKSLKFVVIKPIRKIDTWAIVNHEWKTYGPIDFPQVILDMGNYGNWNA